MKYVIKNLNGMAKGLGKQVAKDNGFSKKELKSFIKVSNIKSIIQQHCQTKSGKFYIDDNNLNKVYEEVHQWLVGVDLARLAANDILDCYWDDEKDCMVFKKKGIEDGQNDLA